MKKGKILLLNPTAPENPPNYFGPPYGLSLVAASLLGNGREVAAHDFERAPLADFLAATEELIRAEKPRYVGLPIQSSTRGSVYAVVEKIKKTDPEIKILIGGPFATTHHDLILNNFPVDYAVIGDGERTAPELLDRLDSKQDPAQIPGIALRKNSRVVLSAPRPSEADLDALPLPAFHLFRDFDKKINEPERHHRPSDFIINERSTNATNALLLLSSRGCIYDCNFCPMSSVKKNKIRFHSPEFFTGMVAHFYKKYHIRNFIFGDNFFTVNRSRTIAICREILGQKLKVRWSCMTRPDFVDKDLLTKMSDAGCYEVSYGVESGSPKIQLTTRKNMDLERAKAGFAQTRRARMRSVLMLMVGNLGESKKTVEDTLAYVRQVRADRVLVKIARVYPGTRIHDIYENRGGLAKDYYLKPEPEPEPPVFSLPSKEGRIKELYAQIWPKTVAVEIHSNCNNRCSCCKRRGGVSKSCRRIKDEVYLASLRAEHVIYYGPEPILHKDFFEIVEYAERAGLHHQKIYSNGRAFAYRGLVDKITSGSPIEKIVIPFFGDENEHDRVTRVKGAFGQTLSGLKNLRGPGVRRIDLQANILMTRNNINILPGLVTRLRSAGVDRFHLIYGADSYALVSLQPKSMPPLGKSAQMLKALARLLSRENSALTFEGWPQCLTKDLLATAYEWHAPFDEIITLGSKIILGSRIRQKNKIKPDKCRLCKRNPACEGLWSAYFRAYGDDEIKKQ